MSLEAFSPSGNTVLVAASSSTSVAATQLTTTPGVSHMVRVVYPSTSGTGVPIYVAFGSSSVSAAVATTATPAAGTPIAAGTERVFTIAPSTAANWISAVTSAGTAAPGLFATPGSFGR